LHLNHLISDILQQITNSIIVETAKPRKRVIKHGVNIMEDFQFVSPTRYFMGRTADRQVGEEVRRLSDKVLMIHYGNAFIHE